MITSGLKPRSSKLPTKPCALPKKAHPPILVNCTPTSWSQSDLERKMMNQTMVQKTYRDAVREAMREEMLHDERVLIMGEEVGVWGGTYAVTRGLYDEFGEKRVKDTPIAEAGIVGTAVGAAMGGLKPIAELMTINFSLVAIDQIVNNAAKIHSMFGGQMKVPVVIRTAAGWG